MTDRLYYTEPYTTEFEAVVESTREDNGRILAVLDRTAFYPTSGGQPFDTGVLGGRAVLDVIDLEDGHVAHVLDGDLVRGSKVRGTVDWARRFDHMQQHTGQHVLSAAFDRRLKARTVSFHLGTATATIDLHRELSQADVAEAEVEANRVIWEDRPVTIRFASADEAASLGLRKESTRAGTLRLIEVNNYDLSACGGTHVRSTGAVGMLAVRSTERFRGGLRVEFVCGGRALRDFRLFRDTVAGGIRVLSVAPEELPATIERTQTESKEARRVMKGLQERLASYEAEALVERGAGVGSWTAVTEAVEGWDAAGLKALAVSIVAKPGRIVALFSTTAPALAVMARSADVPLDSGALLRSLTARFGGNGGGKPDLAQGGGLTGSVPEILEATRAAIEAALPR